jgi:hypothetical protein
MAKPPKTPPPRKVSPIKWIVAYVGGGVFLGASVVIAYNAWRYQSAGLPMPNMKGGTTTYAKAYEFAGVLFVVSLVYLGRAWTLTRAKPK